MSTTGWWIPRVLRSNSAAASDLPGASADSTSHPHAPLRVVAPLIVFTVALYLAVTIYWQSVGFNPITGDEPHFLLIAESLIRDRDFHVTNNYAADTAVSEVLGTHLSAADRGHVTDGISISGIGLPILIALPYAVGSILGAKLALALMSGIALPLIVVNLLYWTLGSLRWSALLTIVMLWALPYLPASNQLFSDLPAGILVLGTTALLVRALQTRRFSFTSRILFGIQLAFLPWLYYRYIPPALVLFCGALYVLWWLDRGARFWRMFLLTLGTVVVSWGGVALYNFAAYDNPFGFFKTAVISYELNKIVMVSLGLHLDSFQGIFMQQPLLWLALVGLVPFIKADWRAALLVILVYLAALAPSVLHQNWYGGSSFAGRYSLVAVGLWMFPLAHAAKALLARRYGALFMATACAAALLFQLALAGLWLTHNRFLYNHGLGEPLWAISDLYTPLLHLSVSQQLRLPSFRNFDLYWSHVPNYVILGWSLLLVLTGAALAGVMRRRRLPAGLWGVFAVVAFLALVTYHPPIVPWERAGAAMPHQVGEQQGDARVGVVGEPGYILYGPYIRVFANRRYKVTLDYATGAKSFSKYDLALAYDKLVFDKARLPPSSATRGEFTRVFTVPSWGEPYAASNTFEFRVLYRGRGKLSIDHFRIEPVE